MINLVTNSLSCELKGIINRIPTKRGYKTIQTIYGQEKNEFVRGVFDISLKIDYISADNYEILTDMFLNGDVISISDIIQGGEFVDYEISGNVLKLSEQDDFERKEHYYNGSIELHKI